MTTVAVTAAICSALLVAAALVPPARAGEAGSSRQSVLWRGGEGGYHTYRIPSLLATERGTLLAFCEGRRKSASDHGDIDLLMRRSEDGGETWSAQEVVHGEEGEVTIGNPCPVQDADGVIWLPVTRNNRKVLLLSSVDDGRTWTAPRDISATATRPDWQWVATGPGVGIRLERGPHRGRLIVPCDYRLGPGDGGPGSSFALLSDDGAATWRIGEPVAEGSNECQVVELEDGRVLVNARMQSRFRGLRGVAVSGDGGETWKGFRHDEELPCPKCQASITRYGRASERGGSLLLFSNPGTSRGRRRLTIRQSRDEGESWPVETVLNEGPSAYSCLAVLPDGTVAVLYEAGAKRYHETLRLARFVP